MSMFRMTIWVVVFGSATMGFGAPAHCRGADTVFEAILNFFTPRGAEPAVDADAEWVVHEIPEVLHHPIVARKRRKRA